MPRSTSHRPVDHCLHTWPVSAVCIAHRHLRVRTGNCAGGDGGRERRIHALRGNGGARTFLIPSPRRLSHSKHLIGSTNQDSQTGRSHTEEHKSCPMPLAPFPPRPLSSHFRAGAALFRVTSPELFHLLGQRLSQDLRHPIVAAVPFLAPEYSTPNPPSAALLPDGERNYELVPGIGYVGMRGAPLQFGPASTTALLAPGPFLRPPPLYEAVRPAPPLQPCPPLGAHTSAAATAAAHKAARAVAAAAMRQGRELVSVASACPWHAGRGAAGSANAGMRGELATAGVQLVPGGGTGDALCAYLRVHFAFPLPSTANVSLRTLRALGLTAGALPAGLSLGEDTIYSTGLALEWGGQLTSNPLRPQIGWQESTGTTRRRVRATTLAGLVSLRSPRPPRTRSACTRSNLLRRRRDYGTRRCLSCRGPCPTPLPRPHPAASCLLCRPSAFCVAASSSAAATPSRTAHYSLSLCERAAHVFGACHADGTCYRSTMGKGFS